MRLASWKRVVKGQNVATGSNKPTLPLWVSILRTVSLVWGSVVLVVGGLIVLASLLGNPSFNDVALYLGFASLAFMLVYLLTPAYRLVERMELERMAAQGGRSTADRFDLQLVTIARARMRSLRICYILATAGAAAFVLYGVLLLVNSHFATWFGWSSGWWGIICFAIAIAVFLLPIIVYNVLMTRQRIAMRVKAMKAQGVEIIDRPLQLSRNGCALGRPTQGGYVAEGGDCRCGGVG